MREELYAQCFDEIIRQVCMTLGLDLWVWGLVQHTQVGVRKHGVRKCSQRQAAG